MGVPQESVERLFDGSQSGIPGRFHSDPGPWSEFSQEAGESRLFMSYLATVEGVVFPKDPNTKPSIKTTRGSFDVPTPSDLEDIARDAGLDDIQHLTGNDVVVYTCGVVNPEVCGVNALQRKEVALAAD